MFVNIKLSSLSLIFLDVLNSNCYNQRRREEEKANTSKEVDAKLRV